MEFRIVVDAFFHDRKLYPLFMVVSSFVKDQIGAGAKLPAFHTTIKSDMSKVQ